MGQKSEEIRHDSFDDKMGKNSHSPKKSKIRPVPVSTTDRQSMSYVTVRNIESATSHLQVNWPIFVLKELEDNAYDWLNDNYETKNSEDKEFRKIAVRIWIATNNEFKNVSFVHIAVRNSNNNNFPVFDDLSKTFDFQSWHSTKRNQHRMTTGSLGDALKRCLGMGYALWTSDYDPEVTFDEKQWHEPLVVRCNRKEFKIFLKVDFSKQEIWAEIKQMNQQTVNIGNDTEIEVTLPIENSLDEHEKLLAIMKSYYDRYKIGKFSNKFSLVIGDSNTNGS